MRRPAGLCLVRTPELKSLEPGRRVQAIRAAVPLRHAAAVACYGLLKVNLELLRY
jgi:hypothetical protein